MTREDIFDRISRHRDSMDLRHGDCSLNKDRSLAVIILMEEVGEVARALLEHDDINLKYELYDVAQVAIAWLEGLENQ